MLVVVFTGLEAFLHFVLIRVCRVIAIMFVFAYDCDFWCCCLKCFIFFTITRLKRSTFLYLCNFLPFVLLMLQSVSIATVLDLHNCFLNLGFLMGLVFIVWFSWCNADLRFCLWRAVTTSLWAFATLAIVKRWKSKQKKIHIVQTI